MTDLGGPGEVRDPEGRGTPAPAGRPAPKGGSATENGPVFVPAVKICGLTRRADALAAADAGADYLGVVLVPRTPRGVSPAQAGTILAGVGLRKVIVLANPTLAEAVSAAEQAGADIIQLHGEETPEFIQRLQAEGPWESWKALRVRGMSEAREGLHSFVRVAQGILLDGWHPRERGGSGTSFDWDGVAGFRDLFPPGKHFIAAGGLKPQNVRQAVSRLRPHVVDVSSGVESEVGVKDHEKISAFVRNAKGLGSKEGR